MQKVLQQGARTILPPIQQAGNPPPGSAVEHQLANLSPVSTTPTTISAKQKPVPDDSSSQRPLISSASLATQPRGTEMLADRA